MIYNNLPSVKTLSRIKGVTPETAKEIRKVLETRNRRTIRRIMEIIDEEVLEGERGGSHGVEYIPNSSGGNLGLDYLNMGDPYDITLIYDWKKSRFIVSSWGDIVEKESKRFSE